MPKIKVLSGFLAIFLLVATFAFQANAAFAPNLGSAGAFAQLDKDTDDLQAERDAVQAFNQADSQACNENLTGQNLSGTILPGVYCFDENAIVSGVLRLDGAGVQNPVFIFKAKQRLEIRPDTSIILLGSARSENVFWKVDKVAVVGSQSIAQGNILAKDDVSIESGAILHGRAISINGRVSLSSDARVSCSSCIFGQVLGTSLGGPLACIPGSSLAPVGQPVMFRATGGDGRYVWSSPNLTITNPFGDAFRATFNQPGAYSIRVASANQTAFCSVSVSGGAVGSAPYYTGQLTGGVLGTQYPALPNTGFGPIGLVYLMWAVIAALIVASFSQAKFLRK